MEKSAVTSYGITGGLYLKVFSNSIGNRYVDNVCVFNRGLTRIRELAFSSKWKQELFARTRVLLRCTIMTS